MKKLSFDLKVIKLAEKMEGKVLRTEWSSSRYMLKTQFYMSTEELHRAFGIIGEAQVRAAKETTEIQKVVAADILKKDQASRALAKKNDGAKNKKEEVEPVEKKDPEKKPKAKKLLKPDLVKLYKEKFNKNPDESLTVPLLKAALKL